MRPFNTSPTQPVTSALDMRWDGDKVVTKKGGGMGGIVECPDTKNMRFRVRQLGFLIICTFWQIILPLQALPSLCRYLHLRVINEKEAYVCYKSICNPLNYSMRYCHTHFFFFFFTADTDTQKLCGLVSITANKILSEPTFIYFQILESFQVVISC